MQKNKMWYENIPLPTEEDLKTNPEQGFDDKFTNLFCYFDMLFEADFKLYYSIMNILELPYNEVRLDDYVDEETINCIEHFNCEIANILTNVIIPTVFNTEIKVDTDSLKEIASIYEYVATNIEYLKKLNGKKLVTILIDLCLEECLELDAQMGMTTEEDASIELAIKSLVENLDGILNLEYTNLYKIYLDRNPIKE